MVIYMSMRSRKFMKKALRVRYLLALLIVLCFGIVALVYFTTGLDKYTIEANNIEFTTEGFESFEGKVDDELNKEKIVSENDDFIMFFDETTTIITVAEKSSAISNDPADKEKLSNYSKVYTTADANGSGSSKSNFELTYASSEVTSTVNGKYDAYNYSINYKNELENTFEKHYAVKYLDDAVQVYYTIGEFNSLNVYFPQEYFATIYKPARCLYETAAEWEAAVEEYETGYMQEVGSLANTFEERFRGNCEIVVKMEKETANKRYLVSKSTEMTVYSEEARDYLIDVVFPDLESQGLFENVYTKEELDEEYSLDTLGNARWKFKKIPAELTDTDSELYKKYFNNDNSPLTNNPFMITTLYENYFKNAYQLVKADGNTVDYSYYKRNINPSIAKLTHGLLYNAENDKIRVSAGLSFEYYDAYYIDQYGIEQPFYSSGFPARDEEGKFLYDEDGNLQKQLYTPELVTADNMMRDIEVYGLPIFKIALEYRLDKDGFVASVIKDSIVDSSTLKDLIDKEQNPEEYAKLNTAYYVADINIFPSMTQAGPDRKGYIIVPDGSGAIINFNNGKSADVAAKYYDNDLAYPSQVKTEEKANLLLGMFAFVNTYPTKGGLLGIIEQGGGQITLNAGVNTDSKLSYVSLNAQLRGKEVVKTGTVTDYKSFNKWDKELGDSDIVIKYAILDETETDYKTIAHKYQQYLIERDGLTYKDNTDTLVNDITFLGSFEKYALFLGIKYMTADSLTTFDQAMEIINELYDNNVNNLSVNYMGWTNEHLEYEVGGSLKVAKVLGKTASMRTFYDFCVNKKIPFYPELSITTTKGYDYILGSTNYTTRSVSNEEAIHYQYDLATGRQDKKLSKTYMISPLFYHSITEKIMKDFAKLDIFKENDNIGGFYLTDLGNQWAGNYRKNNQVYGQQAIAYQQDALGMIQNSGNVKISAPCDYAFKYVDSAVSVPVTSQMYKAYDQMIPFYQLVVSGLFDYSTEQINGLTNRSSSWYLAKALETGSNISYLISADDPSKLLETDYTQYYQAYYANWRDTIINFTKIMNDLGIHECKLTSHEAIDGKLVKVTYTNKVDSSKQIQLVINTSENASTYNYGGTDYKLDAYGYIKL